MRPPVRKRLAARREHHLAAFFQIDVRPAGNDGFGKARFGFLEAAHGEIGLSLQALRNALRAFGARTVHRREVRLGTQGGIVDQRRERFLDFHHVGTFESARVAVDVRHMQGLAVGQFDRIEEAIDV